MCFSLAALLDIEHLQYSSQFDNTKAAKFCFVSMSLFGIMCGRVAGDTKRTDKHTVAFTHWDYAVTQDCLGYKV
jgi:hypothetical protein